VACFTGTPAARDVRATSTLRRENSAGNLGEAEKSTEVAIITTSARRRLVVREAGPTAQAAGVRTKSRQRRIPKKSQVYEHAA